MILATAEVGQRLRIVAARLDDDVAAWVAAVGLHEGEEVVVLRHAAFGGPLHVRTGSGGEFAVAREIAAQLEVTTIVNGGSGGSLATMKDDDDDGEAGR